MAALNGLKTSDLLVRRGLGMLLDCPLCGTEKESHLHFFFGCPFSSLVIKTLLPNGNFFLFPPTLHSVLAAASLMSHKVLNRLYLLIMSVAVYSIWCERNNRLFSNLSRSANILISTIRTRVASKLRRWHIKDGWPPEVRSILDSWALVRSSLCSDLSQPMG